MIKFRLAFMLGGIAALFASCSEAPPAMGSATFFLAETPDETGKCTVSDQDKTQPGSDGSIWGWTITDNGSGLLFCRNQDDDWSAWREASRNRKATHSLKFASNKLPVVFQPI